MGVSHLDPVTRIAQGNAILFALAVVAITILAMACLNMEIPQ